jgi:hypothetical protein
MIQIFSRRRVHVKLHAPLTIEIVIRQTRDVSMLVVENHDEKIWAWMIQWFIRSSKDRRFSLEIGSG